MNSLFQNILFKQAESHKTTPYQSRRYQHTHTHTHIQIKNPETIQKQTPETTTTHQPFASCQPAWSYMYVLYIYVYTLFAFGNRPGLSDNSWRYIFPNTSSSPFSWSPCRIRFPLYTFHIKSNHTTHQIQNLDPMKIFRTIPQNIYTISKLAAKNRERDFCIEVTTAWLAWRPPPTPSSGLHTRGATTTSQAKDIFVAFTRAGDKPTINILEWYDMGQIQLYYRTSHIS